MDPDPTPVAPQPPTSEPLYDPVVAAEVAETFVVLTHGRDLDDIEFK